MLTGLSRTLVPANLGGSRSTSTKDVPTSSVTASRVLTSDDDVTVAQEQTLGPNSQKSVLRLSAFDP